MLSAAPPVRDLVLAGGGHSHVQVLKAFGMAPIPGVRLTIISREARTPYSGMLPGYVAGCYTEEDLHIDLGRLAAFAGARLIVAEVTGLDPLTRRVQLADHPELRYDLLSVNTGAVPQLAPGLQPATAAGAARLVPVKPIGRFLPQWRAVKAAVRDGQRVALVGGGAGGVELALAMRRSLPRTVEVLLLSHGLLPGHTRGVRRRLRIALEQAGVRLHTGVRVTDVTATAVRSEDGQSFDADWVFMVTAVQAPTWPGRAGLATDAAGFIEVDACLRSTSHPEVFAAGDIAALSGQPRPKAGVFAVREGPALTTNLRRALLGRRCKPFRAQRRFLTIMGTADGSAVAGRGALVAWGPWVWRWKDRIDRRFMARFNDLPQMPAPSWRLEGALAQDAPDSMRCGGCGAKLGANPLLRVLQRLPPQDYAHVVLGIGDDAALIRTDGASLVQTVDGFRSFLNDPYLFGRITAHHSLNDIFAMGGRGVSALALATVPLMAEAMMEEDLYQVLSGAVAVLSAHRVPLVGGHSAEGAELTLALSLSGELDGPMLTKAGLEAGHCLVLTKALGTGALLAANMRGLLPVSDLQAAVASMDTSNEPALKILRAHDVAAATDVSGFGLLGHLGEMLRASGCGVQLDLAAVPVLSGAVAQVRSGIVSSLQVNNEQALGDFELAGCTAGDPTVRLLADPQTSGGLLAAVPEAQAERCVAALVRAGYPQARAIGRVRPGAAVIER